ncbi:hypothetical protein NO932_02230 [Pelagibacterium sp. 26DY04]|uniref:hypothetical protein n=1 Tax=Pelagibacterium sp. 26DY04 TaxID=2967130 RepID=UPI002815FCD3|nr:hypothetical protein [Pelagibacterium sp. 26DY04]WMT87446.1 hypothetical protein NO932_02230 [Pelagibacterium sp. 26DY04]
MAAASRSSLFQEAAWAMGGTWRLLLGRPEARAFFDFSQRGLAGSFIPLVIATVVLVGFIGAGSAGQTGISAAMQIFILGAIATLRFSALRIVLPRLDALHAFRPYMVASNWASAILFATMMAVTFGGVFVAALILGPASGSTLVGMVLALWGAVGFALLVIEINILRIVARLGAAEIVLALAAQLFAILAGLYLIGQIFQG